MRHLYFLFLLLNCSVFAQNYNMDDGNLLDDIDFTTCSGTFYDSGGGFGRYQMNEDLELTFSSGSNDTLKFIFNPDDTDNPLNDGDFDLDANSFLYVYDGIGTSGTLLMTIDMNSDPGASHFYVYSISPEVTFHFTSQGTRAKGWRAQISCVPTGCGNNPAPADDFANAPYVCNLDGFCATTVGYTEDLPANLTDTGGTCPQLFGGTIENNSWIQFTAVSNNINLEYFVPTCYDALGAHAPNVTEGIQAAIFYYDGVNFTRVSDCAISDGTNNGTFNLTSNMLVPGQDYYIITDGSAGSQCDYQITVVDGSGIAYVNAGDDQTITPPDTATLTATGPPGATYTWTSTDPTFGTVIGNPIMVSPTSTHTYTVTITGGTLCDTSSDSVVVDVDLLSSPDNSLLKNELIVSQLNNQLNIELTNSTNIMSNVQIYDILGRNILNHPTNGSSTSIDMQSLSNGQLYILKILLQNGHSLTSKFIKQ